MPFSWTFLLPVVICTNYLFPRCSGYSRVQPGIAGYRREAIMFGCLSNRRWLFECNCRRNSYACFFFGFLPLYAIDDRHWTLCQILVIFPNVLFVCFFFFCYFFILLWFLVCALRSTFENSIISLQFFDWWIFGLLCFDSGGFWT